MESCTSLLLDTCELFKVPIIVADGETPGSSKKEAILSKAFEGTTDLPKDSATPVNLLMVLWDLG